MIDDPRQPAIGATGDRIGFVQKCPRAQGFAGEYRRGAGKSPHSQDCVRGSRLEQPPGRAIRLSRPAKEGDLAAAPQTDRRQGHDPHIPRVFCCLLVHFLRRDQQRHFASALDQFLGYRQPREKVAARSATSDGDSCSMSGLSAHEGCGAVISLPPVEPTVMASEPRPWRAILSSRPTYTSIINRFE